MSVNGAAATLVPNRGVRLRMGVHYLAGMRRRAGGNAIRLVRSLRFVATPIVTCLEVLSHLVPNEKTSQRQIDVSELFELAAAHEIDLKVFLLLLCLHPSVPDRRHGR
jgi:hypothetical protein